MWDWRGRCNLPWAKMVTESQKRKRTLDSLPDFLKDGARASGASSSSRAKDPEAKKRRREEKEVMLKSFRPHVP